MLARQRRTDVTVTKTISMPVTVLDRVLNEADIMNASFSEATTKLLLIALATREDQRRRDERQAKEQAEIFAKSQGVKA